ncbi:polyribonucleotide nucleotidyltransferase [bacterium]|jgi:polyribonucleotide nucleotidyltransferase|nr:polyribonucleotide nucleotidyltransferase [bacterium]
MIHTHTFEVGGHTFHLESGRVAKQAGGSVLLGVNESVILGTATMSQTARDGIDFLPLVCDFEERKYAIGKIPGGVIKRGGRPSTKATLISRLMDRPIRPLFPKGCTNEIQVIAMPFSIDATQPSDVLAVNAAGAALAVSDVPFNGPIACVRIGLIEGEFIVFPTYEQMKVSTLDLIVAGHKGAISMVESGAKEVSEEVMVKALLFAHENIQLICKEFEAFAKIAGKEKRVVESKPTDKKFLEELMKKEGKAITAALFHKDKTVREAAESTLKKELKEKYKAGKEDDAEFLASLGGYIDKAIKEVLRATVIKDGKRPDGRKLDELRPIEAVAGLLPRVHGSGLFTRGQTQVMTVLTLGMPKDAQYADILDQLDEEQEPKRFMHFYNFPPYSVGEARPLRGPGRREVGHGALAERAIEAVVPMDDPDFPYTVHLISEVLESNGSSSMASVCGSTLALMDAGVKIKAPVAGIAMGLMSDGKNFSILTDIQGLEDHTGDMDFKVAGTREGITALQLDTKLEGIPEQVLIDALTQAKDARYKILDIMEEEIAKPRAELSGTAPRIQTLQIDTEKIGLLIGPGGANIRRITEESGCEIDVQKDGRVLIASSTGEKAAKAVALIKGLTAEIEVGFEFTGTVTRLMGRGALVSMPNGKDGMVPTDQLTKAKIGRPDDVLSEGDVINVRVHEVDGMGRINLSAIGLNPDNERLNDPNPPVSERPAFSRDRDGGGRDRGGRGGRDGGRDGGRGGYGDRDRGPRRDSRDGGGRESEGEGGSRFRKRQ